MPVYDYYCTLCAHRSSVAHSMDDTLVDEPCLLLEESACEGRLRKDYRSVRIPGFVGRHAIGLGRPTDRFWEGGLLDHEH